MPHLSADISDKTDEKLRTDAKEYGSIGKAVDALVFPNSALRKPIVSCEHLSNDGSLCGVDFKKTTAVKCELCQRERNLKQEEIERSNEAYCGFRFSDPIGAILSLRREIEELKKPRQDLLDKNAELTSGLSELKNSLVATMEERDLLRTSNAQLRNQIEEMSHDALVEKNSFLTVEVGKKDGDIKALKLEIEKEQALVEKKSNDLNSVLCSVSKMLRDLKENMPLTTEPYGLATYINNVQKRIEQFEGFISTLTA